MFYLLRNATDTPTCGPTVSDACATFPGVLDNFGAKYNTTDLPTLEIISDVSIVLNEKLLVRTNIILEPVIFLLILYLIWKVLSLYIYLTFSLVQGILN